VGVADAIWVVALGAVALAAVGAKQCGMGSLPPVDIHTDISLPCFMYKGGMNRAGLTCVALGAFQERHPFAGLAFGDSMLNATKGLCLFRWGRMF
jgi:hypothetical protein